MTQVAIIITPDELQSIVRQLDVCRLYLTFVAVAIFCTYQAWFYTRPWLLDAARVLSRTGFFIAQKPCAILCAV